MTTKTKIGFIIEQALGHITHGKNLAKNTKLDPSIEPFWGYPKQPQSGLMALPGIRNWTLQAGLQSTKALRDIASAGHQLDVIFFHTQVTAILAQKWMAKIPSVVSLDATPMQYDSLGEFYEHESGPSWLENFKFNKNKACYQSAKHLVTWSDWAKQSLIADYDVPDSKITVIPPGVNINEWQPPEQYEKRENEPVKILFVGGDLERKGGKDLINAFKAVKAESPDAAVELHIATRHTPEPTEGMHVYTNMQPNSDELKALYHQADIFCLPTYGDCLPMVLSEAAATKLPIISTSVAAIPEIVQAGKGGLLVKPGDVSELKTAILALIQNKADRIDMGERAFQITQQNFDAQTNALRLFDLLKQVATH